MPRSKASKPLLMFEALLLQGWYGLIETWAGEANICPTQ
jgi:hypothetical protein